MIFLPIIERELRVTARRKSTYRLRLVTGLIAIAVCFLFLSWAPLTPGSTKGSILFAMLSFYSLGLCLLAGPFVTADCLSREKREGTLGLLFLTDLKGHDVVFGKFVAASMNAFFSLFAILPVIALSLLLGGVTGAEFWRMALALINTLFFSLTVGIWVSARSSDPQKAMGNTMGILVVLVAISPVINFLQSSAGLHATWSCLSAISPYQPFAFADETHFLSGPENFWMALAVSHLIGWIFLLWASRILPRSFEEQRTIISRKRTVAEVTRISTEAMARSKQSRAAALDADPVLWLMSRNFRLRGIIWCLVAFASLSWIVSVAIGGEIAFKLTPYVARPFLFLFKAVFAIQVCRFFIEARRDNSLELLCCAPLSVEQIISGQWQALRRQFLGPALVLVIAQLLSTLLGLAKVGDQQYPVSLPPLSFSGTFYECCKLALDLLTVGWMGMWLAFSSKRPNLATGATILYVLVFPSLVLCIPDWLPDLYLICWARNQLLLNFRVLAANQSPADEPDEPQPAIVIPI